MNRYRLLFCVCFFLTLSGCHTFPSNPPVEKNGRLYGVVEGQFRHRWWNYFERGQSFASGGFHDRAGIDFREAIRQFPADKRRVPTYGRHLANYFPHRELGISLFRKGHFRQAVFELEQSLEMEPSARAQFYLDRARKEWIREDNLDRSDPKIQIISPTSTQTTNELFLKISGIASDDTFISNISVNGDPIRMYVSSKNFHFKTEIPLVPGDNPVEIVATDLAGKISIWEKSFPCDRIGPEVSIWLEKGKIRGFARDSSGIASATVDGVAIPLQRARAKGSVFIHYPWAVAGDFDRECGPAVLFQDRAGNQTVATPCSKTFSHPERLRGGTPSDDKRPTPSKGRVRSFALIIGIDDYKNGWEPLKTASSDAKALANLLRKHYGFQVETLINREATGGRILSRMKALAHCLDASDNLLVYFAGHGELERLYGEGYWIPVNGHANHADRWVTNSAVQAILGSPETKINNVLVIADSCYGGSLLTQTPPVPHSDSIAGGIQGKAVRSNGNLSFGIPEESRHFIERLRKSRQVISSGYLSPVSDGEGGDHSPFAKALLHALRKNQRTVLEAERLFNEMWGPLFDSGHRPAMGRMKVADEAEGQFHFYRHSSPVEFTPLPCENNEVTFPDSTPPNLSVGEEFVEKVRRTFLDRIVLPISADDPSGIQWISVKVDVQGKTYSLLSRPVPGKVQTSFIVPFLKIGKNDIEINYSDQLGNVPQTPTKVTIIREVPAHRLPERRMPMKFKGFISYDSRLQETGELVRSHLTALNRFNIREASQGNQNKEIAFSLHGKQIALKKTDSSEDRLEIVAEIWDPAVDDEPLRTVDVYGEGEFSETMLKKSSEALALKIVDTFPQVQGEISRLDSENNEAILDRGSEDRLFPGLRVLFFQDDRSVGAAPGAAIEMGEGRIINADNPRKSRSWTEDFHALQPEMKFIVR